MKQLREIMLSLLILCTLQGLSVDLYSRNVQKSPKELQEKKSTDPGPNLDGVVEVSFKIDNLGKVQILNINSTSPQLSDYVLKKLGKIQLEQGNSQLGKVIKYRFVFKKQA